MGQFQNRIVKKLQFLNNSNEKISAAYRRYGVNFTAEKLIVFISFFACAAPPALTAQIAKTVSVVYAAGGGFTLVRGNSIAGVYTPSYISKNALILQDSDVIQTPPGAFVEAHVYPGGASVRIAENTSVIFENIGGSSMTQVISLVYGRIRIDQRKPSETILVKAGPSITEIQNGSVNFDLLTPSDGVSSQLVLHISAISGSALFLPAVMSQTSGRIRLKKNETLIFNPENGQTIRRPMDNEIAESWAGYTGKNTVSSRPAPANNDFSPNFADSDAERYKKSSRWKTGIFISGAVLVLAGVSVQTAIHYDYGSLKKSYADAIYYSACAPIALGAAAMLGVFFYR